MHKNSIIQFSKSKYITTSKYKINICINSYIDVQK